jgi:hypothetical protein
MLAWATFIDGHGRVASIRHLVGAPIEIKNIEHHVYAAHLMPLERESARNSSSLAPSPKPINAVALDEDAALMMLKWYEQHQWYR